MKKKLKQQCLVIEFNPSYIEEIVSLENWGIDLVYNTYQKALKLFPQDERVEEWGKMIERIEAIIYKNKNK